MNHDPELPPDAGDPLDALLREANPHVPDDGFTRRVLLALPPHRRTRRRRDALLAAAWIAGLVILVWHADVIQFTLVASLNHARRGDSVALFPWLPVLAVLGSLVWAWMSFAWEESG